MLGSQDIRWIKANKALLLDGYASVDHKMSIILEHISPLVIAEVFFVDDMPLADMRVLFGKKTNGEVRAIIEVAINRLDEGDIYRLLTCDETNENLCSMMRRWYDDGSKPEVGHALLLRSCKCSFENPLARRSDSRGVTPLVYEVIRVLEVINCAKNASSSTLLASMDFPTRLAAKLFHNALLREIRAKKEAELRRRQAIKRTAAGRIADKTVHAPVLASVIARELRGAEIQECIAKLTPQPLDHWSSDEVEGAASSESNDDDAMEVGMEVGMEVVDIE